MNANADAWGYRHKPFGGTYGGWTTNTTTPTTLDQLEVLSLPLGKVHVFQVRVRVATLWSDPSAEATANPLAPAGLRSTPGDRVIHLDWAPMPGVTRWQYRIGSGGVWTTISGSSATTAGYTLTGLTNGTAVTNIGVRVSNATGVNSNLELTLL